MDQRHGGSGWGRSAEEISSRGSEKSVKRMGHPNVPLIYRYAPAHRDKRRSARLQPDTPNGEWTELVTDDVTM